MTVRETRLVTKFAQEVGLANGFKFVQSKMQILDSSKDETGKVVYAEIIDLTTNKHWKCNQNKEGTMRTQLIEAEPTPGSSSKELVPEKEPETVPEKKPEEEKPEEKPVQSTEVSLTISESILMTCIPFSKDYEDKFESDLWLDTLYDKVHALTKMGSKAFEHLVAKLETKGFLKVNDNCSVSLTETAQRWMLAQGVAPDYNGEYDEEEYVKLHNVIDGLIEKLKLHKGIKDKEPVKDLTAENVTSEDNPTYTNKSSTLNKDTAKATVKTAKKVTKKATKKTGKKPIARTQVAPELKPGEVLLKAFTGMIIGVFKILKHTDAFIEIQTNKGLLKFDSKTLRQLNAHNPKFANRIEVG